MYRKLRNDELHRLSVLEYKIAEKLPVTVVLDNVRSRHNIGAAFRSADSFLVEKLLLCGICAVPPTAEIHKSALGAEFSVEWEYFKKTTDAVAALKERGYRIICVEQTENSTKLHELSVEKGVRYALVFGNEVRGVAQEVVNMSDEVVEIPQFGTKHSLNVSVSVGIVLWEYAKKCHLRE